MYFFEVVGSTLKKIINAQTSLSFCSVISSVACGGWTVRWVHNSLLWCISQSGTDTISDTSFCSSSRCLAWSPRIRHGTLNDGQSYRTTFSVLRRHQAYSRPSIIPRSVVDASIQGENYGIDRINVDKSVARITWNESLDHTWERKSEILIYLYSCRFCSVASWWHTQWDSLSSHSVWSRRRSGGE